MKPIVTIDGFEKGILLDPTKPVRDGFNFCSGLDIFKEPGILQLSKQLDVMTEAAATDDITDRIKWMVKYGGVVYGLGGTGRIYDYNETVGGKWSLVHDDGNTGVGNGMIEFNDNLYWASNTNLGQFNGTTWTDSHKAFQDDDAAWHPMAIYLGKLMIGDGRYIATLDTDGTWNATALTLPDGFRVRSIAVYGDRLVIGTWRGTNIYDIPEATLFTWDGTSEQYEYAWSLNENGIHALHAWKNTLICFAGVKGNIYAFNGATLKKVSQIPDFDSASGYYGQVYPGAVSEYMGNLIFGFSAGTNSAAMKKYYGIYILGQATDDSPIALVKSHSPSAGEQNDMVVGAIYMSGTNAFYASFSYGSTYGVDTIDVDHTLASGYKESQTYEVSSSHNGIPLKGVQAIARPLQTSNTIVVKYKIDNAASWTTLGTITSSNQSDILKGFTSRAKTIQIRLDLASASGDNYSPEISKILIY